MASEDITFRTPNFEDDLDSDASNVALDQGTTTVDGQAQMDHAPRANDEDGPAINKTHDVNDASKPLESSATFSDRHESGHSMRKISTADPKDADLISAAKHEDDDSNGFKSVDPSDKTNMLAPTHSIAEGESHQIVKKQTYTHRQSIANPNAAQKHATSTVKSLAVLQNVWAMFSTFPYWDMAFWSGFCYSIGSIMFIIDGAFSFGPLASPNRHWPEAEDTYAGPILFFFGAVVFYQTGAVMAYLEAVNDGCFAGVAMKRFWIEGSEEDKRKMLDDKLHAFFGHIIPHHHHFHHERGSDEKDLHIRDTKTSDHENNHGSEDLEAGWLAAINSSLHPLPSSLQPAPSRRVAVDHGATEPEGFHEYITWRWWPTLHALRTYHSREVGYIACSIQLLGATLYGVTGVVVLPGVLSSLAWWQKIAAFWVPQVVASVCFLTAGIMFTLMTQDKWYKMTPWTVRWWIGGWASIGSVGFLLCACFGLGSHKYTWCEYQSDLSSMWGSVGYLFSSLLQWYEAVSAGPVLAFPNNRTPILLRKVSRNK